MIKNKRGISVVIGYVLLVVIAISISLLVYAWLKSYVPKETEECPEGVSLYIARYNCTSGLELTLRNNGRFNVEGFILRVKIGNFFDTIENQEGRIEQYFAEQEGLIPNDEETKNFLYSGSILEIEIQPFVFGEKQEVLICPEAVIRQELENC